jgi:hypothetical protein
VEEKGETHLEHPRQQYIACRDPLNPIRLFQHLVLDLLHELLHHLRWQKGVVKLAPMPAGLVKYARKESADVGNRLRRDPAFNDRRK